MSQRPITDVPQLPAWKLNACLLWPEWPAMDFSEGERTRFLSHRAGGYYSATVEARDILLEDLNEMYSKRAGLTAWLKNEREQGTFNPMLTPQIINIVDAENDFEIEDALRAVLIHFDSGGPGRQYELRDDRGLVKTNLDLVGDQPNLIRDIFEDARILARSGCGGWDELGVIMDNLEGMELVKKMPLAGRPEWHIYSLTFEGLQEAKKVKSGQGSVGFQSQSLPEEHPQATNSDVFVIHGRNEEARVAISDFLVAIGLNPIQWEEAVKETGQSSPYVGPIISAGLGKARAAIAFLHPMIS